MQATIALRVVRGPDWRRGNEDGGEGGVGTVVFLGNRREYRAWRAHPPLLAGKVSPNNLPHTRGYVVVQWDIGGYRREYKCGGEATYELRVLDSSPTGGSKHTDAKCSACRYHFCAISQRWLRELHTSQVSASDSDGGSTSDSSQDSGNKQSKAAIKLSLPGSRTLRENTLGTEPSRIKNKYLHKDSAPGASAIEPERLRKTAIDILQTINHGKDFMDRGGKLIDSGLLSCVVEDSLTDDEQLPSTEPLAGIRWQCAQCIDYTLCSRCYHGDEHSTVHQFLKIVGKDPKKRTLAPVRILDKYKVEARGIFEGARVIRGSDFDVSWDKQDGGAGNMGTVVEITSSLKRDTVLSVAYVRWDKTREKNIYRLGHDGKVDLQCTWEGAEKGFSYYPKHLPVLGDRPDYIDEENTIVAGDRVVMELDIEFLTELQREHGGFNDAMAGYIGRVGVVNSVTGSGDIIVCYNSDVRFNLNKNAVKKVDTPFFCCGDYVRVLDDKRSVVELQQGHGSWDVDMDQYLGAVGLVVKVIETADVLVEFPESRKRWNLNSHCLKLATEEEESAFNSRTSSSSFGSLDRDHTWSHNYSLDDPNIGILLSGAATGDVNTVRAYVNSYPNSINTSDIGRTPLHVAVMEGHINVVRELLSYNGIDVDIPDSENLETPLHAAAHNNRADIAKLLLDKRAYVGSENALGMRPLSIAAATGNCRVLSLLVNPGLPFQHLNAKDCNGNTALHLAVQARRARAVSILINAGADVLTTNIDEFSPLSEAAKCGFFVGIELFTNYYPLERHINHFRFADNHTLLHIAAANDHLDVLCYLASREECKPNAQNIAGQTPLHVASETAHPRMIEWLVGYRADPTGADINGVTLLHLILARKNMDDLSQWTPELNHLHAKLLSLTGSRAGEVIPSYMVVACFLIREGADPHRVSSVGLRPLDIAAPHEASLMRKAMTIKPPTRFRGSLPCHESLPAMTMDLSRSIVYRRGVEGAQERILSTYLGIDRANRLEPGRDSPGVKSKLPTK